MNSILLAVIILGVVAFALAGILFFVSKRFSVVENPKLAEVASLLPQANCGGCGYAGCKSFAEACVNSSTLEGKLCPVGGEKVMKKIAVSLGMQLDDAEAKVAVVRCNGSCINRPHVNIYDGLHSCAVESALYEGETMCEYGCLGLGDCVSSCKFDAIHINPDTWLSEVDETKCKSCGACVKACPRHIIELRYKAKETHRVYVSCVNKERGGVARKGCAVACIGCGKCQKVCQHDAISIEDHLAYIDYKKCVACDECVDVCPQHCIHTSNQKIVSLC
jgi:electron transport complex protein RnfB